MTETLDQVEVDVDLELELPCEATLPQTDEPCPNSAEWRLVFTHGLVFTHETCRNPVLLCTDCKDRLLTTMARDNVQLKCSLHQQTTRLERCDPI